MVRFVLARTFLARKSLKITQAEAIVRKTTAGTNKNGFV